MTKGSPKPTSIPKFSLSPEEKTAMIDRKPGKLFIGMPAHDSLLEKRVPLTPGGVSVLVNNGHRVAIESGVGKGSRYTDNDFSEAGAEVMQSRKQVFEAQIILKIAPPTLEEAEMMHQNQVLLAPIQLATLEEASIHALVKRKVIALAFEYIKDDAGSFPLVRSMSEIAGNTAILIASEYLSHDHHGKGILLGGISGVPSARVVILGAGVVGEFACRTALGLGATVKVFDNNIYKLMRLQNNIGTRVFTSILDPRVLAEEMLTADVAIGAIHSELGRSLMIVPEAVVSRMKPGSVIVDVSIDQGGCFETSEVTTHDKPTYTKHEVIHYCVPNIPSRVSRTASQAISNIISPLLLQASALGGVESLLHQSHGARHGAYVYKGCLCNRHISEKFGLKYTDVNLLFTSGM